MAYESTNNQVVNNLSIENAVMRSIHTSVRRRLSSAVWHSDCHARISGSVGEEGLRLNM